MGLESIRNYARIIGRHNLESFLSNANSKNLRVDLLRMQGMYYINISGNTIKTITIYSKFHFHSSVRTHLRLNAGLNNLAEQMY